ncbi:NTP transferase domain-containing protein [Oceanicola sp. 502str15]|uniref:nucleotidyltransferase family protein n=1 Tax=Oceanicola sp. 502str15 TaxID=2696061 RepID=UPI00209440A9|nr:nucleotidyltransferase family protein [Oceanicola sp. 502str15]MCO6382050.1 NTP transferase domain-containing protein [Oceanicola sp. 502str15]
MTLPILILAAGAASRMAPRDKLLEPINGTPLLTRITEISCKVSDFTLVALPPDRPARQAAIEHTTARLLTVSNAAEGMNATLRAGLAALPKAPAFMLLLADLPDLTEEDLRAVLQSHQAHPEALIWRGATSDGKPGHPVIFSSQLYENIQQLQGDDGAKSIVAAAQGRVHLTPLPGQRARLDLDTPEAWASWRKATNTPR